VRVIKLGKNDRVIGAHPVTKEATKTTALLTMGANGYGKKTPISEYKIQNRGGSGIKTGKVTPKTGEIIASQVVAGDEEEAVAMSKKSQVIRLGLSEIPSLGRQTQGVRIMKLRDGDAIASFICL
jgi:DNA gyrase subunit A